MKAFIAAIAVLGTLTTSTQAASICKGLPKAECEAKAIANVQLCTYVGPYYTTTGKREYCRSSGRKVTEAQYQAIQAALSGQPNTPTTPAQ